MFLWLLGLIHSVSAKDLGLDRSSTAPNIKIEGTAYHEVPVVNLSAAVPELAKEVGRDEIVRSQDCTVNNGDGVIAILVTGGEPPRRRYRSVRESWETTWGPGRVALVLIGAEEEGAYTGSCDVANNGRVSERTIDWTVKMSSDAFPQREASDTFARRQYELDGVSMFLKKTLGWRERGIHEGEVGALDYVVHSAWSAWEFVGINPSASVVPAS